MNLALFDFDGTITTGDSFIPFLQYSARPRKLIFGALVLSPVMAGYRLGLISANAARPLAARVAFSGEDAKAIREVGTKYAQEVLPRIMRRQALDRISWHQQQGDCVVVVSASLDVYLKPWCDAQGVEVICTRLEEHRGRLTGRYVQGDCCGVEKLRRVRQNHDLSGYERIYGYGDTEDDHHMLSIAHEQYYRWEPIEP